MAAFNLWRCIEQYCWKKYWNISI